MKISTYDGRDKLIRSIQHHYVELAGFREVRRMIIRACAGDLYVDDEERQTLFGMLRQSLEAHVLGMAANLPRVMVTAKKMGSAGFAREIKEALNIYLRDIHIDQTLQACAYDSFFGPAYCRLYLKSSLYEIYQGDTWLDPGMGFAERISPEDVVYDTTSDDFRNVSFVANRYQLRLEEILEDKARFPKKSREALLRTIRDEETARDIGGSSPNESNDAELKEMIDMVDVYIPDERRIYTFSSDTRFNLRNTEPLQVIDWEGSDEGPIRMLNLGVVPDNIAPSAPANYLYHMDAGVNQVWRRLLHQAERMKVIGIAQGLTDQDIDKYNNAEDGETISGDPEAIKEARYGGPDAQLFGIGQDLLNKYSMLSGNLNARLGTGPAADTLGQERMLAGQINQVDASMQIAFLNFATGIVTELGRMLFEDPVTSYDLDMQVKNSSVHYKSQWKPTIDPATGQPDPTARFGEWNDYDYCIEPGSMPYKDPATRANLLLQDVGTVAQLAPAIMPLGGDIGKLIDMLAELHDLPRLREVFPALLMPQEPQQGQQQQSAMPGQKPNGNYTRTNVSGGGPDMSQIQQLMASGQNA